jgi:hypothetical protein
MAIGVSIAALAIGTGLTIYGQQQQKKAADEYQQTLDEAGDPTNPYANLQPSTLGANYQGAQNLRSEATQMNMLSKSGSRGLAYVPQVARGKALKDQEIAADLNRQQSRIDQLKAGGERFAMAIQEQRLNRNLDGDAQLYGTGNQNMAGGINLATGSLASAMSEGGAFNQGQQAQQLQPYATGIQPPPTVGANLQGFQPTVLRPQSLISN